MDADSVRSRNAAPPPPLGAAGLPVAPVAAATATDEGSWGSEADATSGDGLLCCNAAPLLVLLTPGNELTDDTGDGGLLPMPLLELACSRLRCTSPSAGADPVVYSGGAMRKLGVRTGDSQV